MFTSYSPGALSIIPALNFSRSAGKHSAPELGGLYPIVTPYIKV
jgi:hypothetical protein